jgi:hypothetical protein
MPRSCEWCREPIAFLDAQTSSGNAVWHTRCWNHAVEQRTAYIFACEDSEGFARRSLPDELPMSETGATRWEVIPIMATAPATPNNTRAPREVVEFPPNVPITVALKYGHAKTVSSQYGERFMFSLVDGRVMFLDPDVGGKIEALGINVRENFTITRKWDEEKGVQFEWEVARLAGEQPDGTFVVPVVPSKPAASASTPTNDSPQRQPTVSLWLVEEANNLVDSFAAVLDHALPRGNSWVVPPHWQARVRAGASRSWRRGCSGSGARCVRKLTQELAIRHSGTAIGPMPSIFQSKDAPEIDSRFQYKVILKNEE